MESEVVILRGVVSHYDASTDESEETFPILPAKLSLILNFLQNMESKVDIVKNYKIKSWQYVDFLACRADKRVPGLGTELMKRAAKILDERGVKVNTAE